MPPKKSNKTAKQATDQQQQRLWQHRQTATTHTESFKTNHYYNPKWHQLNFDVWNHGYIWKKGYMWYRRPDGVDVRAHAAVNELTDTGELLPKSEFTA